MCYNRSGKGGIKNTMDPSINLLRGLYQNISFVYGHTGFVLHVASKGDKVRVTRSTLGRNRKCCCEHQLLLRLTRAVTGLGLPRRCQIKRLLCCVRRFAPPTFTFQKVLNCTGGKDCIVLAIKGCHLKEHYLHNVAALRLM